MDRIGDLLKANMSNMGVWKYTQFDIFGCTTGFPRVMESSSLGTVLMGGGNMSEDPYSAFGKNIFNF